MNVAVAVLAAGGSSRMGRPKQLLPFRGTTLLRHAAEVALAAGCGPVVVVLGADADRLRREVADLPLTVVVNDEWESGPGTSIRTAVRAAAPLAATDAVLFTLCDQPFVAAADLVCLVEGFRAGARTVAAEYAGTVGVPALFAREWFAELDALSPAGGAKQLLTRAPDAVARVPVPNAAMDLDTPDDYARWVARDIVPVE